MGAVWIPLAAAQTVAHRGDNEVASLWLEQRPAEVRYVLRETHDNTSELRQECHRLGGEWVAARHGPSPHGAGGVAVRQVCHTLRSQASEPCNGLFQNVFEWRVNMPVKGLQRSQLLALGAVVLYQLVLLSPPERRLTLGKGIKPWLRAA